MVDLVSDFYGSLLQRLQAPESVWDWLAEIERGTGEMTLKTGFLVQDGDKANQKRDS